MTGLMHLAIWVLCLTGIFLSLLVFWVERQRLGDDRQAGHIALGAVLARVYLVLVKTGAALGMSFWLFWNHY